MTNWPAFPLCGNMRQPSDLRIGSVLCWKRRKSVGPENDMQIGHARAKNAWDGAQPPAIRGKIITPVSRERLSGSPESKGVSRTYKEILEIKSLLSESLDRPHRACCCRCPRSEEGQHGGTRRCH